MPANSRVWHTTPNVDFPIVPTSDAELAVSTLFLWKALILSAGWTMYGSSDGVTAGLDGADRWGDVFDAAKIPRSDGTLPCGWVVLQSPVALGSYWIILSNQHSTTAFPYRCQTVLCHTAPAGGTINTRPTDANEFEGDSVAMPICKAGSGGAHRASVSYTDDGDFVILTAEVGTGRFDTVLVFVKLDDAKAADPHPVVFVLEYQADSILTNYRASQNSRSVGAYNWGTPSKARCLSFSVDGSPQPLTCVWLAHNDWGGATVFGELDNTPQGILTVDAVDGYAVSVPILMFGTKTVKGKLPDISWAPPLIAEGTLDDGGNLGSPESVVAGDCWVPWTAAASPLL